MSRAPSPEPQVRIILLSGVDCEYLEADQKFATYRCKASDVQSLCGQLTPTVVLVDLASDEHGEFNIRRQLGHLDGLLIVAISDLVDEATCEQLLRFGYAGLLRREESPLTVVRAIEAVVKGQLWFPRQHVSRVLKGLLAEVNPNGLTARESEILKLIGVGLNNQQIADKLFVSRETVRWHVKSLNTKLQIGNLRTGTQSFRSQSRRASRPAQPDGLTRPYKQSRKAV